MTRLLARWAENLFWLARYVERAENLARILDVQETFARDSGGRQDWRLVLVINADAEAFFARHAEADSANVLRFYVTDRSNPTSIVSNVLAARENARALRPLISTEMWTQLNVFYNRLMALTPAQVVEEKLSVVCEMVKQGCDAHTGITAGTFYRDEGWCFYQLGAAIECADQTTRLLDAKFLNFMAQADLDPGSAADSFYWMALLRSAAGYQAFRRRHPRGMVPEQVAAFLLCDPCFPRSVACCLGAVGDQLTTLRRFYGLRAAGNALQFLDEIRDDLEVRQVKAVLANGELHRFDDFLQRSFIELTWLLGQAFFGHAAAPTEPPARSAAREAPAARQFRVAEPHRPAVVEGAVPPSRAASTMTRLEVRHATVYRYANSVTFGPHRAMLRPRDSHDLKLRSATLTVSPAAAVSWVYDVFGNSVTLLEFTEPGAVLRVESRIELEQFALDEPDYPLAPGAERWPFAYDAEDRLDLGPTLNRHYPDEQGRVRSWAMELLGGRETGTLELLTTLTRGIKERLAYSARQDEGTQEPLETLEKGGGTCRDYALLMMEAVRSLGFGARFVTGYLYDPAADGGRNLIRVGVVRDPKQAVPIAGSFTGAPGAFLGMEVDVRVSRIDDNVAAAA